MAWELSAGTKAATVGGVSTGYVFFQQPGKRTATNVTFKIDLPAAKDESDEDFQLRMISAVERLAADMREQAAARKFVSLIHSTAPQDED